MLQKGREKAKAAWMKTPKPSPCVLGSSGLRQKPRNCLSPPARLPTRQARHILVRIHDTQSLAPNSLAPCILETVYFCAVFCLNRRSPWSFSCSFPFALYPSAARFSFHQLLQTSLAIVTCLPCTPAKSSMSTAPQFSMFSDHRTAFACFAATKFNAQSKLPFILKYLHIAFSCL